MTAHMERITNRCQAPNCPRHKDYRVYNQWNWNMGDFCQAHATAEVKKLQQEEQVAMSQLLRKKEESKCNSLGK